jgi:hypothetical protein
MNKYQFTEPFDPDHYLGWRLEQERIAKETPLGIDDLIPPAALADPPVELNLSEARRIPLDPGRPHGTVAIGATPAEPDYQVGIRFRMQLDPHAYLKLQALPPAGALLHEAHFQCGWYPWGNFCPDAWTAINAMAQRAQQAREQQEARKQWRVTGAARREKMRERDKSRSRF